MCPHRCSRILQHSVFHSDTNITGQFHIPPPLSFDNDSLSFDNESVSMQGYNLYRMDRTKDGGGVAFYVQNHIPLKVREDIICKLRCFGFKLTYLICLLD